MSSNAKQFSELAKSERELEAHHNALVVQSHCATVAPVTIEPYPHDLSPGYVPTSPSYSPTSPEYRVRPTNS
jgi:hypothetical protein